MDISEIHEGTMIRCKFGKNKRTKRIIKKVTEDDIYVSYLDGRSMYRIPKDMILKFWECEI